MTHGAVLLRDPRDEDLETLHRLDQLCFEPGIAYTRAQIRRFLRLATARGVVAEVGGEIAGFAIGYRSRRGVAHVLTLDVHPEFRRRRLGHALLRAVLSRLAEDGATETRLEVDVRNAGAIAFYERLGFRPLRRLEDYYAEGRAALEMGLRGDSLPDVP
ncbi:MAG: GNAT family N-acetyltransferase [Thermoanaerobaculia bacterium]|nr:GNAT family N-acetyltransferase [Thermoanaerobaculia bacterium]